MTIWFRSARYGSVAGAFVLVVTSLAAQSNSPGERFTATAINTGGTLGRTGAQQVEIVVDRWSTEAERSRLMSVLLDQGPAKLLDALQAVGRLGYIRTPDSLGYELHFARKTAGEEGGEHITIATDRYISFWEAANRPRTIDYPFTVIELHMTPNGEGEGKLSIATKISADKARQTIVLENFGIQPVLLTNVRRETKR